jgi:serine/threonine protein kinase
MTFFWTKKKRAIPPLEDRKAAFSVGGNLVKESIIPITHFYNVSKTLLGRGSSAEVVVGEHLKTKRRYAIKIIDISRKEVVWRYDREKNFLKDIEHTNVIRLYEVYTSPNAMFFVMELCTGGHLGHTLKNYDSGYLPELKARNYVLQLTRAIMHFHGKGICHRDIKLQNVLLESNAIDAQLKVVDFGNAVRYRGNTPLTKVCGTTYSAAPEVFRQSYDERCDVWSLGVVAYILLCGRRPFERLEIDTNARNKDSTVIASILMGRYHFQHEAWGCVSDEAIDFIKCCLEMDYKKRLSAKELLAHPWMSSLMVFTHQNAQQQYDGASFGSGGGNSMLGATISNNGAITLRNTTTRHLSNSTFGGMRHASMLAVAFSMPIAKVRQLRDLFQEIDRNGNGVIGKLVFFKAIFTVLLSKFVKFFRKRRISSSDDASSSGIVRKRHRFLI